MCCKACIHTNSSEGVLLLWQATLFPLNQESPGTHPLCTLSWRECFWTALWHHPMLCCATESFKIALLCRREEGTWPQPFPKLLTLCCGLQELLCPGPRGGASSPFYPKMCPLGKRMLLCLSSCCHHQKCEAIWCHESDEQSNGVAWLLATGEDAAARKPGRARSPRASGFFWWAFSCQRRMS